VWRSYEGVTRHDGGDCLYSSGGVGIKKRLLEIDGSRNPSPPTPLLLHAGRLNNIGNE
jgi:hypothetical protein